VGEAVPPPMRVHVRDTGRGPSRLSRILRPFGVEGAVPLVAWRPEFEE
jgi:hypothetical protein